MAAPECSRTAQQAPWGPHHLVSIAVVGSAPDLIPEAVKAGWRTDAPAHAARLPATAEAQEKLRGADLDRKLHDSGHPDWNREVIRRLPAIERALSTRGLHQPSDAYAEAAKDELTKLQNELRQQIISSGRLSEIQAPDGYLPA